MARQAGQRRRAGRPQLPAALNRRLLPALALALAGCASGPFEWRADVSPGDAAPLLPGTPLVADPKPPRSSGFIMRSLEPFVPMSEAQANRCYSLILSYATSESLQKRAASALGAPVQDKGYPRLLVSVALAELRPSSDGVAFVLRASAQSAASAEKALRPSTHAVRTPVRKPDEWLASDSELLRADLEKAMDVLAASIASAYR